MKWAITSYQPCYRTSGVVVTWGVAIAPPRVQFPAGANFFLFAIIYFLQLYPMIKIVIENVLWLWNKNITLYTYIM